MEWVENLPERLRNSLNSLLETVQQNEEIYDRAEKPAVAQIWTALSLLNERNKRLEKILKAQRKALEENGIEVERGKHLDENLEESLKRY